MRRNRQGLSKFARIISSPQPATTPMRESSAPKHFNADEILRIPHGEHARRADLINAESRLGSQIFGPIPAGHQREFFHDHDNIWIWHESWANETAEPQQVTIRYEVRETGVYKKVSAGNYVKLQDRELENFRRAAQTYLRVIKAYLYS